MGIHPEACSRRPAQPGAETCRLTELAFDSVVAIDMTLLRSLRRARPSGNLQNPLDGTPLTVPRVDRRGRICPAQTPPKTAQPHNQFMSGGLDPAILNPNLAISSQEPLPPCLSVSVVKCAARRAPWGSGDYLRRRARKAAPPTEASAMVEGSGMIRLNYRYASIGSAPSVPRSPST